MPETKNTLPPKLEKAIEGLENAAALFQIEETPTETIVWKMRDIAGDIRRAAIEALSSANLDGFASAVSPRED